jgi:RNA polymerase sigma factor (sigma-70 family)
MAAPEAWVHRVAQNLATSWVRRRMAERRATHRLQAQRVEAQIEPTDDVVALRSEIKRLPARQRTALVLRYFADLPAAQVGVVMGCSEGTVRALSHQAVTSLRQRGELTGLQEATDAI